MRKVYRVTRKALYQGKWEEAGLTGRCPDILRHPGTDWDKVAQSREFWLKVVEFSTK